VDSRMRDLTKKAAGVESAVLRQRPGARLKEVRKGPANAAAVAKRSAPATDSHFPFRRAADILSCALAESQRSVIF
jgi:hypothetical protein